MSSQPGAPPPGWIRHFPLVSGLVVTLMGAAVLAGWREDVEWIKSLSPQYVAMKPNTALAFVLLGVALVLSQMEHVAGTRAIRWLLELLALTLATATLAQYALGVDLGIDLWLAAASLAELETGAPGRMGIVTAVCIALCASALLAGRANTWSGRTITRALASTMAILGLLSLLGYLYGAPALYQPFATSSAMPVHGAAAFIVLACGIAALHPQYGLPNIASGRTLVGAHVRWMFPAAILVPLFIGGIVVQAYEQSGLARATIAITAGGTAISMGMLIWLAAVWLRRMEHRLEVSNRALAATRHGVLIADGAEPGYPIVYVNDAFQRLSGYTMKEAIGREYDFLVAADPDDPEARKLRESLDAGGDCTVTVPSKRRDGTVFSGRLSLSAVPGTDGARHVVALLEDVTGEQLAAKARLELLAEAAQARKEAESASRWKDVFFASVTHELRSPLNACLMWLDVLALGPLSDKSAKGIDAIRRNLKIQTRLVNDLIDAAKVSAGGIEIDPEPVDMGKLIERNIETWHMLAAARRIRFSYVADGGEHDLNADPERLIQALNNLLDNAFKYTESGGAVELRLSQTPDAVDVEVADSGAGLSAEDLQRVFTLFWRRRQDHRQPRGLGLGLAIAENLVKGHRGTLTVTSDGLGKGCTFRIRLPRVGATAGGDASAAESPLNRQNPVAATGMAKG